LRLDSPLAEGDISVELPLLVDRIPDDPRHLGPIHVRESLLNDPSNQRRVWPVVAPLGVLDHVARQRLSLTEPVGLLLLPLGPGLRRGWPRSRTLDHAALLTRHRVEEHQVITKLRSAELPLSFKPLDLLASLRIEKDRVRPVSDHQRGSRLQVRQQAAQHLRRPHVTCTDRLAKQAPDRALVLKPTCQQALNSLLPLALLRSFGQGLPRLVGYLPADQGGARDRIETLLPGQGRRRGQQRP